MAPDASSLTPVVIGRGHHLDLPPPSRIFLAQRSLHKSRTIVSRSPVGEGAFREGEKTFANLAKESGHAAIEDQPVNESHVSAMERKPRFLEPVFILPPRDGEHDTQKRTLENLHRFKGFEIKHKTKTRRKDGTVNSLPVFSEFLAARNVAATEKGLERIKGSPALRELPIQHTSGVAIK